MAGVQNKITNINQHGSNKSCESKVRRHCSTVATKRWQIWPWSEVYLKNWMFVMAYGFWDCWIPLASDQRSFTMLSFIWDDDDVSQLSDWSLIVGLRILLTHTHTHLNVLSPASLSPLMHTNAICLYDSKSFLVILCRMKRAKVSLASHTQTLQKKKKKKKGVCSLWRWLAHQLADLKRKRKPLTFWQSKNEKVGAEWRGGCHINFLTSVQSLPSVLSFYFSMSPSCRLQGNMGIVLVMSPTH